MTTTWNRDNFSVHLLLCAVAFAVGVLIYANILHVTTLHAAVGVIVGIIAILSAF